MNRIERYPSSRIRMNRWSIQAQPFGLMMAGQLCHYRVAIIHVNSEKRRFPGAMPQACFRLARDFGKNYTAILRPAAWPTGIPNRLGANELRSEQSVDCPG